MAHEGTVKLRDGRALGYAEYGDPSGTPILEFHGLPGSRFYSLDQDALVKSGARLLSVERPGIGLSDPSPARALTDWPLDVADLADRLELDRFAVLGTSAGAAYALATGLGLPEQVTGVGLMCALGSAFDHPEFDASLSAEVQALMPLARQDREATVPLVQQFLEDQRKKWQADPDGFFDDLVAGWPENDRAAYQEAADIWRLNLDATYCREGAFATDIILVYGPWQLDLSATKVPVRAWHGTDDSTAPIGLVQKVIDATGGELVKLPGQGHYVTATFHDEIIQWLVDPRR
jgi:pimeloyl-ACP methyl ester carboxylesterase